MRKVGLFSFLIVATLLVSSCDFARILAGRPTSADIEAKRALIAKEQEEHQRRLDSLQIIQKQVSDSLAALDSIRMAGRTIMSTKKLAADSKSELKYRYYVVIGSFSNVENAGKLSARAEAAGYEVSSIVFQNGFNAVAVCPTNNVATAFSSLREVQKHDFCPVDAWILVNE